MATVADWRLVMMPVRMPPRRASEMPRPSWAVKDLVSTPVPSSLGMLVMSAVGEDAVDVEDEDLDVARAGFGVSERDHEEMIPVPEKRAGRRESCAGS